MNKEQQELVDRAYDKYLTYLDDNQIFINSLDIDSFARTCTKDSEDVKMWGLKIEERELSLEERLKIADKFNPLIREDCLTKTHHPDETDELKLVYRHEWLDSLGPNVVPQRKLITITYNNETIESYV